MKQPQQVGSLAEFSPFVQQAQQRNLVDESFLMLGWQACKHVSQVQKMKQGHELLVTLFFLPFHRRGNPEQKKTKLCNALRSKSFEHTDEHTMFTMWAQ